MPTRSSSTLCWMPLDVSMNLTSLLAANCFPSAESKCNSVIVLSDDDMLIAARVELTWCCYRTGTCQVSFVAVSENKIKWIRWREIEELARLNQPNNDYSLILRNILTPQVIQYLFSTPQGAPLDDGVDDDTGVWLVGRQWVFNLLHKREMANWELWLRDETLQSKLTLISLAGWSMKIISDSSPSRRMLTVFSPNSSSSDAS